jgi:hypothetical protein
MFPSELPTVVMTNDDSALYECVVFRSASLGRALARAGLWMQDDRKELHVASVVVEWSLGDGADGEWAVRVYISEGNAGLE